MPGTNPAEAMRVVAGELPDFPHLPELPDRGPGADLTGRTAALLIEIPVEVTPRGWRLAERPAAPWSGPGTCSPPTWTSWRRLLDGFRGPLKIQLCGPWTLAATLELPRTLNVAIADPGAVADLTASLAEGAAAHVAEVAKRVPGAHLVVQLDEPALAAVAGGEVPTASGLSRLRPVEAETLRERLAQVIARHREIHGGAQLRSRRPVRHHQGGGGRCPVLRPQPATARGRGRGGRGRGGGHGPADRGRAVRAAPRAAPARTAGRRGRAVRVTAAPRPGRRPSGSSGSTSGWGCRWPRCPSRP